MHGLPLLVLSLEVFWEEEFFCYYIALLYKQLDRHVAALAAGDRDAFTSTQ